MWIRLPDKEIELKQAPGSQADPIIQLGTFQEKNAFDAHSSMTIRCYVEVAYLTSGRPRVFDYRVQITPESGSTRDIYKTSEQAKAYQAFDSLLSYLTHARSAEAAGAYLCDFSNGIPSLTGDSEDEDDS